jgi:UDP-GlcNAc:undecaprenyl-phosphate GlcNAc-1-phosphate transferase
MWTLVLIAILGPLLLSWTVTALVKRWAIRIGFVDRPGGHKQHERVVALGGGLAIFAAIAAPLLAGTVAAWTMRASPPAWLPSLLVTHITGIASKLPELLGILAAAAVLHIVGIIDDRRPLGPAPKFLVQFAAAGFIAGPLGVRAAQALPAPLSIGLTVLWIVWMTNAFNFLDNMDGLSAGVAAVAAAIFAVAAMNAGQIFVPIMAWVMVGALLGFLIHNFSPASIFMGDAGSLPLGFLMGVLTILTTYYDPAKQLAPIGVAVPLLVLAVPIYDVTSVVVRRRMAGVSPLKGDRRHFSHRLVKRGLSPRSAVLTIYLATAATGLPAVILPQLNWVGAALLLLQCACVVVIIALLESTKGEPPQEP